MAHSVPEFRRNERTAPPGPLHGVSSVGAIRSAGRPSLAAGHGTDHQKWLRAGSDGARQWRVRWVMRQVLLTRKEPDKWSALVRPFITHGAAQHRIALLERIEDRALRHRAVELQLNFTAHVR